MSARPRPNLVQRLARRVLNLGSLTISELDRQMDMEAFGRPSSSGSVVAGRTAVNFAAFFCGVLQICQTIASCRTTLYRQTGAFVKEAWSPHPVHGLLTRKVNPVMSSFQWKERMQYHAMVWGNGYSFIDRDSYFRPRALWPLNPERVIPRLVGDQLGEQSVVYDVRDSSGNKWTFGPSEIFHLQGFGFDPVRGYSLLEIARETIGLGLAQQEFSGRFLSNGAHLGGLLTVGKTLTPEARERLKVTFSSFHSGVDNSGKFAVLEEGMDYKTIGMPLEDAQFLESKVFQIGEIARILNISPYKLKDYSHATFSNIEHLGIEYATDTIRPWAERWEAAIDTQLLTDGEAARAFAEFDLASIQRGDFKAQSEAFAVARNGGWMNADEIRFHQGMNPIDGKRAGRTYWRPKNMADAAEPDSDGGAANGGSDDAQK